MIYEISNHFSIEEREKGRSDLVFPVLFFLGFDPFVLFV